MPSRPNHRDRTPGTGSFPGTVDDASQHRTGTRPEVEFLAIPAACAFTSLSRRTLDYAKDRGDLPYLRCGRKVLFRRGDLIDWLERGRIDVRADIARMEG